MSQKISVDSCVFLSSVLKNEIHHNESKQFFKWVLQNNIQVHINILNLFEILQSYYRQTQNMKRVDQLFSYFVESKLKILPIEASFLSYFSIHHSKFNLKTADCIVALSAMKLKTPLITWDKKLIKNCGGKLEAFTPDQFIKK